MVFLSCLFFLFGTVGCSFGSKGYLALGPMLGHVSSTKAHIWIKGSTPGMARVLIGEKSDLSDGRLQGALELSEDGGKMGTLTVEGLKPQTRYYYSVLLNGGEVTGQPYASFVTPITEGQPTRIRVAFSSCFGRTGANTAAGWGQLAANAKADVILMLGDNHYADSTQRAKQSKFYFSQRDVSGFRAATRGTPSYGIWDDHDYGPNDSDRTAKGKEISLETFKMHWANPSYGQSDHPGIYSTFLRGNIQFVLLDDRYYRDPNRSPATPAKTLLGVRQKAWLKATLKQSAAKIKLVALGSEWQLNGHSDSYTSFKSEQKEILDFLRDEKIEGVILLSGDRHFTGAYQIRGQVIEVTAGPLGSRNYPTKNLPDMFMNHGEGKLYAVLDLDTRTSPPKVVLEVHRAGDGVVYKRNIAWGEVNGRQRIKPLPLGLGGRK